MGVLGPVVIVVAFIVLLFSIKKLVDVIRSTEQIADNANLTIQYVTLLHEYGVDSEESHQMKLGQHDNATFLHRAKVLDMVFREKNRVTERVDHMWEGK